MGAAPYNLSEPLKDQQYRRKISRKVSLLLLLSLRYYPCCGGDIPLLWVFYLSLLLWCFFVVVGMPLRLLPLPPSWGAFFVSPKGPLPPIRLWTPSP